MLTYAMIVIENYLAELKREEGQGMAEYALIIALVAVVLITALGFLSGGIGGVFENISNAFDAGG